MDTIFPAAGLETVDLTGGAPLPTCEEMRRRPFVGVWSPDGAPLSAEAKNLSFVITASETAEPHLTSGSEAEKLVISVPNVDETLRLLERVNKVNPVAVAVLHQVLVAGEDMTLDAAFTLESLAYSALLGGAEYQTWLATQGSPSVVDEVSSGAVSVDSSPDGDALLVTLDRPQRKNAFGRVMRAELLDTLRVLDHAPSLRAEIRGAGTVFCSGGDLEEFGTAPDVATAHLIRTEHHVGRAILRHRDRITVHAHGACIGAGLELPALAKNFIAAPRTWFHLPEVGMGLIPGAGGTVSVPQRIGRWRTAYMAITGEKIDTRTAHTWGLVDDIASL